MEQQYNVYLQNKTVGHVHVSREGLYYRFDCRVQLPPESRCRLEVFSESTCHDLGLCVPMDGVYGITTRVPVKKLGGEDLNFRLKDQHQNSKDLFVPILTDKPFEKLNRLEKGFFAVLNGQPGVVFRE